MEKKIDNCDLAIKPIIPHHHRFPAQYHNWQESVLQDNTALLTYLEEFEKKLQPIWKKKVIDRNIVYKDAQKEGWKNKNQNMQLEIK